MMSIAISHPLPQYHIEEYDTTLGSSILCWSNMNTSISIYPRYMYAYSNFNQFLFTRCSTHLHIVHTLTNDCSRCLLDKALILLFFLSIWQIFIAWLSSSLLWSTIVNKFINFPWCVLTIWMMLAFNILLNLHVCKYILKKQNKTSKPIHCGHILCFWNRKAL